MLYRGACKEQDFRATLPDTGLDSMTGGRVKRTAQYVHLSVDDDCVLERPLVTA